MGLFLSGVQKRISKADIFTENVAKQEELGIRAFDQYGNGYKYVQFIAAATRGQVAISDHNDEDTLASSTDLLKVTQVATWTVNEYAGYNLYINDGTGEGQLRRIKSNTATVLTLEEALTTALSVADSDADVFSENHVILAPVTALVNTVVGIAVMTQTIAYYGWIQTSGVAEVLMGEASVAGGYVTPGDDTAGSAKNAGAGETIDDVTLIGYSMSANTAADKGCPIMLMGF